MKRLACLLIGLLSCSLWAAERPSIGLVLSGGGAKGTAHVGVLKVLEAHHIPVDYVAGTSIGAFVGGLYSLGYSADEIERIMLGTDWAQGYSDTIPREALSYRDKQQRDKYNIPINMGYSDGQMKLPSGVLQGQTMSILLRNATNLIPEYTSFSDMAIPYRAVATNLVTSDAVVLSSGSLIQAMQASASVPGALQPMQIDGKLLVDGGIANNMPVDVAKAMGADIVIAVDIGSSLMDKKQLDSTVAVLNQLSTMLTNASTERQKTLLTDKDVLIRPDVGDMSTTDFSIMPKALPLGVTAAMAQIKKLQKLAVSDSEYAAYIAKKRQRRAIWQHELQQPISKIVLENDSHISDQLILDTLGLKSGQVVDKSQLDAAIDRVYALNLFERVGTKFIETPTGRKMVVTTRAKSWGPNYFQLGLNWEDDFTLDSAVTLDLAYTMTDLTPNGGQWRNEVRLGFEKKFGTEFYQPLDPDQLFYTKAEYQYEIKDWDLYHNNNRVAELNKSTHRLDTGLGYNFDNPGRIEVGFTGEWGNVSNKTYLPTDFSYNSYGGYMKLGYDTLNSISFPTSGNRFNLNLYLRREDFSMAWENPPSMSSFQIEADWKGALSFGNHAFVGKAAFSTVNKDGLFSVHLSELGGFLNMSGLHKNALVGPHKVFGAVMYQYDLGRDALGMTEFPLYLGTSFEAGNVWELQEQMSLADLIYSSSVYVGTDTALGPAALGFGITDKGDRAFYLFIGKNF